MLIIFIDLTTILTTRFCIIVSLNKSLQMLMSMYIGISSIYFLLKYTIEMRFLKMQRQCC